MVFLMVWLTFTDRLVVCGGGGGGGGSGGCFPKLFLLDEGSQLSLPTNEHGPRAFSRSLRSYYMFGRSLFSNLLGG